MDHGSSSPTSAAPVNGELGRLQRVAGDLLVAPGRSCYGRPTSMSFVAKKIFLTSGVGKHREKLSSFEMALRAAGIAQYNLVRVSSIFPPHAKLISKTEGMKLLRPGQILYVVMSENATNEPHRLVAASVGVAIPKDRSQYGYLSEHHSF